MTDEEKARQEAMGGLPPQPENVEQEVPKGMTTPTGFFTGFNIKYPEYEVLVPQTLQTFTVRSLSVSDEEALKASMKSPRQIPSHLNNALWECLVKKPDHIKSRDDFYKYTTIKDREALVYALFHVTYKDEHEYNAVCEICEHEYPIKIKMSDVFKMTAYNGNEMDILKERVEVKLETVEGGVAVIKQPTLQDEELLMADMLFQSEKNLMIGTEMLIIEKFRLDQPNGDVQDISDKLSILNAYTSLPSRDRKAIGKAYVERFGDYKMSLPLKVPCPGCGNESETEIDLVQQFFRSMFQ